MKKFFAYLRSINSAQTSDSAKRFYGGFGFVTYVVLACIFKDLREPLLYVSAALIGLESVTSIWTKK